MYKIFDYHCKTCNVTEERMVDKTEEEHVIHSCGNRMVQEIPNPRGQLQGTENRVRQ